MQQNLRAGVEVALLAREATPAATVVIVTGNKDAINTSVFEAAGVNRVIDKFDSHPRACRELLEVALTVLNHETAHS